MGGISNAWTKQPSKGACLKSLFSLSYVDLTTHVLTTLVADSRI